MTREELVRRADSRTYSEHVRVYAVNPWHGIYRTPSKHGTGWYMLYRLHGNRLICECPGFGYRESCKHIAALAKRLEREHKAPQGLRGDPAHPPVQLSFDEQAA